MKRNEYTSIGVAYKDVPWPELSGHERCDVFDAGTLLEVMEHHGLSRKNDHFCTVVDHHAEQNITFGELLSWSRQYAAALLSSGLNPGDRVAVMLTTRVEFLFVYFGAMLAGLVPAPVAPPFLPRQMDHFVQNRSDMLKGIHAAALVTSEPHEKIGRLIMEKTPSVRCVLTIEALKRFSGVEALAFTHSPQDTAMIQFSSGSGGRQKAIALTHDNIMSNVRSVHLAMGTTCDDAFVIWLPMYHDMGLLGCLCQALFVGCRIVLMSPTMFMSSPVSWLNLMHDKGGTISVAPNFGYQMCVDKIHGLNQRGMDLSRWRLALNGAEMVTERTMALFTEKFAPTGFQPSTFMPVYGLAEATLAVCFTPPATGVIADCVDRRSLETDKIARPASDPESSTTFISVGKPIPGVQVRIVDDREMEVGERVQGRLFTRSLSVMTGYVNDPESTHEALKDGWLNTGDLAYRVGGFVFLTGRSKDIIIKAGRNYYPEHFEQVTATVPGIRKNSVAAFSVQRSQKGTEDIVVMAEANVDGQDAETALIALCRKAISGHLELMPDDFVILPPMTIPKTTSGKIQRSLCRELYLENQKALNGGALR